MKTLTLLIFGFLFSRSYSQVNTNLHCQMLTDSIIVNAEDTCSLTGASLNSLNFNKSERYYRRYIYFIGGYDSLKYFDHFDLFRPKDGLIIGLRYRHNITNSIIASVEICLNDTARLESGDLKKFYKGKISFLGVNIDSNTHKNILDESAKLKQYKSLENENNNSTYNSKYIISNITYFFRFNEQGQILTIKLIDNGLN